MAQTVQIILEDDLEGGPAEESVEFGFEGKQYVIDLNPDNAARLREALAPYIAAGRKAATGRVSRPSTQAKGRTNPDIAKIRVWAKDNGYPVSDRGRIHQDIQDAYYAAN